MKLQTIISLKIFNNSRLKIGKKKKPRALGNFQEKFRYEVVYAFSAGLKIFKVYPVNFFAKIVAKGNAVQI